MSDKHDRVKLEFIQELIIDIERIIERHSSIEKSLDDFEGHHAILMCLMQIGESLNKIKDDTLRSSLPVDLAYKMRNIIAHDYIGINKQVISQTITEDIPALSEVIKRFL